MKIKILAASVLLFCFSGMLALSSCKKDKVENATDTELLEMARETNGFVWFESSDSLLNKSSGSGHPQAFLRTRYNSIAATRLDSNGRIIANAVFPEGSVIVKELCNTSSVLERYAILYKKSDHVYADSRGWVWGYINVDGSVVESASKKGSACSGCHSQTDNIDYMLMNKYFP